MLLHALTMAAAALGQTDAPADDADAELNRYYSAAMERLADQGEDYAKARTELRDAQRAWIKYRDAECGAVFTSWAPGSIARTMAADCSDRLTRTRTHAIWAHWLTYEDSTPPILPEPSRTSAAATDGLEALSSLPASIREAAIATAEGEAGEIAAAEIGDSGLYVVYVRSQYLCGSGGCVARIWAMEGGRAVEKGRLPVGRLPIVMLSDSGDGSLVLGATYYDVRSGPEGEIVPVKVDETGVTDGDWDDLRPMSEGIPIVTRAMLEPF
ncbi:MAG: lysozyme inhibitor LprI family protein [Pseudomonadota bacterium]|nr:lysozyme inhibitor LprI family protein [Pseudomonadota bacterium]